jgi:hypothetical protein
MNQQRVMDLLEYDQKTGVFVRRIQTSNRIKVGDVAGSKDKNGYLCIRLDGKTYKAHRLAWLYIHGVWPSGEIDHINHQTNDNRISNLRDVSRSVNQQNKKTVRGYNKDGNRWKAQIRTAGKFKHLGCFGTEAEAHAAYQQAKNVMHVEARK